MCEACHTEMEKAMFEFMFSTGCRIGEIVSLEKDDINWSNRNCKMISCSPIHPFL
ncbi:tyrosine-type recombinase/integrase [Viridibacillus arvi]|uniref:tyrosine-type recombinase/integrase n=1 Tax=Viridibacillus arvi TaxID=263475 RepID=UPI003D0423B2